MMATKKIVSAEASLPKQAKGASTGAPGSGAGDEGAPRSTFTPTPEAKKQATMFRLIAAACWVVAIGLEAFAIFFLLRHTEINGFMVWLIGSIVVIAGLSIAGSMLWKRANRLDPASEKEPIRFFIQNQLGAIIAIIAFLPLIILIFTNKNMSQSQKTIAGVVGIVALVVAGYFGIDTQPPSVEQMDTQSATARAYTGKDEVYWVKGGSVYHLCAEYPEGTTIAPLARGDLDKNPVVSGTVAQAVASGMSRLSMYGFSECGYTEGQPAFPQYLDVNASADASSTASASTQPSDSPS
ncbi:MAG: hypothetical protein LBV00_00405 [Propionibacteriaceae bacterium]|jgi:hypothetical protein|nr:hypothetical protein [Propionibacteriaceae bacterium]